MQYTHTHTHTHSSPLPGVAGTESLYPAQMGRARVGGLVYTWGGGGKSGGEASIHMGRARVGGRLVYT